MLQTILGIVLLVIAVGADGEVLISSLLSVALIVVAAFGLTIAAAGAPASRIWFTVYLSLNVGLICVNNIQLVPYIVACVCTLLRRSAR